MKGKQMERVLVTGASRGIGLEFVRQYSARGATVFAGARNPESSSKLAALQAEYRDRITIVQMDVSDEESIRQSRDEVADCINGLEILVNNAGIGGWNTETGQPERLGTMHMEDCYRTMRTNAIGPIIIAQEYMDLLRCGENAKIANISSGWGSVGGNTNGAPYYYAASKAALHQFMRSLTYDVRQWGIAVVLLDPGNVRTDMGGPKQPLSPAESVGGMVQVIDELTLDRSGSFVNFAGKEMPW